MVTNNQAITQSCRELFKALSDETRWLIVKELFVRALTVGELADCLAVSHYNISKHLKVLRGCGMIRMTKEGRHVRVHLNPEMRTTSTEKDAVERVLRMGCCDIHF